ncbi:GDSL-type esterase/lipase family protein [uncultured Porphyromonas sp.]|uniref:GDSL-type esterase/lipase family protein n=1 Tax=uncultured Porphyromonas sp. TaxID=159274 RepID=UPI00259BAFCD|nr:GDSL-type esterase/lipase family protein [uncultured Porphyromonas sp.]
MMRISRFYMAFLLLLLPFCPNVAAQNPSKLDLLKVELCTLQAPEGYLDEFWQLCASPMNSVTIPIIHLGDSHVQGGYFSMPIRQFFDDYFGIGGLGWVAPYRFLRSNQPQPAKISGNKSGWSGSFITSRKYVDSPSPTGITLTANGMSEVEITATDYFPIKKVVVFRDASTPPLYLKGDSPSQRLLATVEQPIADTLRLYLPASSLTLVAPKGARWYGASLENGYPGPLLHTIGYNGAFYSSMNQRGFVDHLELLRPRLLIISLGTNDMLVHRFSSTQFASNVRSFVGALQRALPTTAIILTSPVAAFQTKMVRRGVYRWTPSPYAAEVAKVLEQEAAHLRCGYIDIYSAFGGIDRVDELLVAGMLSKDRVHLTREGYDEAGKAIAYALLSDFRRYLERQRPLFYQDKTRQK